MSVEPLMRVYPKPRDLRALLHDRDRLFAILDPARDHRVMDIVSRRGLNAACLVDLSKAPDLELYSPYVVDLSESISALEEVLRLGWGHAWGFFCVSAKPLEVMRQHFKRFLNVRTEAGEVVYLRFYDPRILRVLVEAFSKEEVRELFGPVRAFWVEPSNPATAMVYSLGPSGVQTHRATLRHS